MSGSDDSSSDEEPLIKRQEQLKAGLARATLHRGAIHKQPEKMVEAHAAAAAAKMLIAAAAAVALARGRFNLEQLPSLEEQASTGVVALNVSPAASEDCAAYLKGQWTSKGLTLPNCRTVTGYATYDKTLLSHSAYEQQCHTLLITNAYLTSFRKHVPGFSQLEAEIVQWLEKEYSAIVELVYAHALWQSSLTLRSTWFGVHQDTEEVTA